MSTRTHWMIGAVAVLTLSSALVGCSDDTSERAAPVIFDLENGSNAALDPEPAASGVVIPADDLEQLLSGLLGEHADLVAEVMVGAADGDDTTAAVSALQENTTELTGAINVVYGPAGADAFDQLWGQHTQFFAEYAVAAAEGDDDRKDLAARRLHDYHQDFSSFTTTATAGAAPLEAVLDLLHTHVADLTGFIDAHVEGDRTEAAERLDAATSYMTVIADALAGAIAQQNPARFPA